MENMKFYYIPGLATRYSASRRGFTAAVAKACRVGTRVMCHNADGTEEIAFEVSRICRKCGETC